MAVFTIDVGELHAQVAVELLSIFEHGDHGFQHGNFLRGSRYIFHVEAKTRQNDASDFSLCHHELFLCCDVFFVIQETVLDPVGHLNQMGEAFLVLECARHVPRDFGFDA